MEIILVLRGGGVCFLHIFLTAPSRPENIICCRDQTWHKMQSFSQMLTRNPGGLSLHFWICELMREPILSGFQFDVVCEEQQLAEVFFLFMESLIHQLVLLVGRSPLAADLTD